MADSLEYEYWSRMPGSILCVHKAMSIIKSKNTSQASTTHHMRTPNFEYFLWYLQEASEKDCGHTKLFPGRKLKLRNH